MLPLLVTVYVKVNRTYCGARTCVIRHIMPMITDRAEPSIVFLFEEGSTVSNRDVDRELAYLCWEPSNESIYEINERKIHR